VSETVRALIATAALAASGLTVFVWRLGRLETNDPNRLIAELRFSQWMALILAAVGGAWLGAAAVHAPPGYGALETTLAVAIILFSAWTLQRETRQSLVLLCAGFILHALIDVSHRPGWLAESLAPRWFTVGCAAYDIYMAALCFWVQRRS
jgi:hypothetical protein